MGDRQRPVGNEAQKEAIMTLKELPVGHKARVTAVTGTNRVSRRLMEMGVVPGVDVHIVKTAPLGDPLQIRVRGYSLAMRRHEAASVEVSDE